MTRSGGPERSDPGITQPRTIPAVLDRIADQFSDHDALITDDRRLTFAELRTEVRRAAAAMIEHGRRRR